MGGYRAAPTDALNLSRQPEEGPTTDPGQCEHIDESTWESFCEEQGHEPSDIEELVLRLEDDEEFDEWPRGRLLMGADPETHLGRP